MAGRSLLLTDVVFQNCEIDYSQIVRPGLAPNGQLASTSHCPNSRAWPGLVRNDTDTTACDIVLGANGVADVGDSKPCTLTILLSRAHMSSGSGRCSVLRLDGVCGVEGGGRSWGRSSAVSVSSRCFGRRSWALGRVREAIGRRGTGAFLYSMTHLPMPQYQSCRLSEADRAGRGRSVQGPD